MSGILSDDELEALLRGVAEDRVPVGAARARGVRSLDLTSQERNLRGRLPGLELVVDRFVRALRGSLAGFLARTPEIHVRGLELVKFARVTATLPERVALQLFRMPPLRGQGMLVLTPSLASVLLEASLGGTPGRSALLSREFSVLEQRVLERFGARALRNLSEAFRPLAAVEVAGLRSEPSTLLATVAAPHDLVLVLDLAVEVAGLEHAGVSLCLPNAAFDPLRQRLQAGAEDGGAPGETFGGRLRAALAGVELEVAAELGTHRMSLREVLGLRVGDVIPLRTGREGPVVVRVEGRSRFLAAPGVQDGNNAVRVTARL